jgi:hypothetical protein
VLPDHRDVLAWARGQILQPTGRTRASESDPVRPPAQTTSKHADGQARAPKLGYRNHDGRVRSKSFKTKSAAEKWSREYVDAERRSRLGDFLLGSDAPEVPPDATPVAELILE